MTQKPKQFGFNFNYLNSEISEMKKHKHVKTPRKTPSTQVVETWDPRSREKPVLSELSNNHLLKPNLLPKQQNVSSKNTSPESNIVQYSASDETALVEVTVKTSNSPKQRSKSTVCSREPWGQLLKKHKGGESESSVFSNFDPLRTLHFLAKELQIHLRALLPDERNVQEIVLSMQSALTRVPPEVASTIHLQQTIGLLPGVRNSYKSLKHETPEKPFSSTTNKCVQTLSTHEKEEVVNMKQLMEESTIKLESSCRHLETLCMELKNDKIFLETQLQNERASVNFFKRRIEDLEIINKDSSQNLSNKDGIIMNLEFQVSILQKKIDESQSSKTQIKSTIDELQQSKSNFEQECIKLKHQLRLCAIEKEKYLAILAVRDRQVNDIRNEMTQLQEVINDQLVELHTNAIAAVPSSASAADYRAPHHNENYEDGTILSVGLTDDNVYEISDKDSLKDFQFGDREVLTVLHSDNVSTENKNQYSSRASLNRVTKIGGYIPENNGYESRTSIEIRDMFGELKKQAYALTKRNDNY